jgi:hypothetical protein
MGGGEVMGEKKPWYKKRDFRKLQKEWYGKLEEQGFYDIEGGVEGHLLKGPTSSVTLRSLANKCDADHGLKNDRAPREFDDVADAEDEQLNFMEGGKARYYHHAMLIAVQAISEGRISDERCYAWTLHANGDGERVIAELLEVPRSQIRKHIKVLRENVLLRLDNEYR